MMIKTRTIPVLLGLVLVAAACGGSDAETVPPTAAPTTTTTTVTATTTTTIAATTTTTTIAATTTTAASLPDPVTASDLEGEWFSVVTNTWLRFNSDGTYEVASDRLGLDSALIDQGRFEVNGDTTTFITSATTEFFCNEGDTGNYRIVFIDADHFRTPLIDDECAPRGGVPTPTYARRE